MKDEKAYYNSSYHAARFPDLIKNEEFFWARAKVQSRFYFTEAERKLRIFEFGCGIGQGIAALPNAAGWDIGENAVEMCRKRGLNVYNRVEDIPRGAWDIVFCRHVLEHVEQPLQVLKQMRELLCATGELYLVLPKEYHHKSGMKPDLDQHLYCWNFRSLNNLVSRSGLCPYLNEYRYALGWKVFLPVRRYFGDSAYYHVTTLGGVFRRNGELVVRARLDDSQNGAS